MSMLLLVSQSPGAICAQGSRHEAGPVTPRKSGRVREDGGVAATLRLRAGRAPRWCAEGGLVAKGPGSDKPRDSTLLTRVARTESHLFPSSDACGTPEVLSR